MTRRQQIAARLRHWEYLREGATYRARMHLARAIMPPELRLITMSGWVYYETMKLRHLQMILERMQAGEAQTPAEPSEDRVVVPIDYLQRYM